MAVNGAVISGPDTNCGLLSVVIGRGLEARSESSDGEVRGTGDESSELDATPSAQSKVLGVEAWWDGDLEDP